MVICFGECIVDFTSLEPDRPLWAVEKFRKNFGGAPANVAVGLHYHGVPVQLWSKVGDDSFGRYLMEQLQRHGLSAEGICIDHRHPTKIAFVGFDSQRDRYFEFHNRRSAEMFIELAALNTDLLRPATIFHFGGVALFGEVTYQTTLALLKIARENHCRISFDPNFRLDLMNDPALIRPRFEQVLEFVHVLKLSADDQEQFFPGQWPEDILRRGIHLLIITEGAGGARLITSRETVFVPAKKIRALDTTGAGDAFTAALLSKLYTLPSQQSISELSADRLKDWGDFANRWAGEIVRHTGAIRGYVAAQKNNPAG